MGFEGFPPEAMAFLRGIKRNNNREWFEARRDVFLNKVKAPMTELVDALNAELLRFAPEHVTEPAKAIYRFYRDTRFSHDKSPYKTHLAAIFPRRGLIKHCCASYYFSVSPKEIEVAGGVYLPQPEQLMAIRRHLAERHEEFRRIVADPKLASAVGELTGNRLSRVPKGFPADHPAADLLRYTQLYVYALLDPSPATTPRLIPEIIRRFKAMKPLVDFLNAPLISAKRRMPAGGFLA